jgi:hypothetical protein
LELSKILIVLQDIMPRRKQTFGYTLFSYKMSLKSSLDSHTR